MKSSKVVGGAKALGPLVEFAAGTGELGGHPSAPLTATPDFGGVLPFLEDSSFLVCGRRGAGKEKSEVPGLQGGASSGQESEPVETKDTKPQPDERTATGNASVADLWSSDGLRGGAGEGPPAAVTLRVRARDLEELTLGLAGPVFPGAGGWTEQAVKSGSGAVRKERLQSVRGDAPWGDQPVTQSAMEVPSEAEGHSDMVGERHDGGESM